MTGWLIVVLALAQAVDPQAAARQAVDDFRAGKYVEARGEFRAALKYSPQNAGLWAYLGLTEGELNDVPAAIAALKKARALAPADPQILFNLGLFYGKAGHPDRSREAYRQGLAAQPDDPGANQNYALLLMQAGLYDQAITPLARLRKMEPENPSVRVSLIECEFKSDRKNEAEDEIRSLLSTPGATLEGSLQTAAVLVSDGVPGAAEIVLAGTARQHDESPEVHAGLGKLLLDRGQYQDAVLHLGRAAQLQPDKAGYALGLADALLRWKHYTPALELLEAVRPKFETLPDYRYKLGLTWYGMARYPQALGEFKALLQERPQADSAWYFLGNTWLAMGNLSNAEEAYHKAISLNPKASGYYAALGVLLRSSDADRTVEAAATLRQALVLDPSDYLSKKELALCEERQGRLEPAAALLHQVVLNHPDFKAGHVALARICYKLHRKDDGDREKQIVTQLEAEERAKQTEIQKEPSAK